MRLIRWLHLDHSVLLKAGPTMARAKAGNPARGRTGQHAYGADRRALWQRDLYLTRPAAAVDIVVCHLPPDRAARVSWWERHRDRIRRDGRVQERLIISLPSELAGAHAREVAIAIMDAIGAGRVPFIAAVHRGRKDGGKEVCRGGENDHLHVDFADVDHETGQRVFGVSDPDGTARLREAIAAAVNGYAVTHGVPVRVDHRRLAVQEHEAVWAGDYITAAALARKPGLKAGWMLRAAGRGPLRPAAEARLAKVRAREEERRCREEMAAALAAESWQGPAAARDPEWPPRAPDRDLPGRALMASRRRPEPAAGPEARVAARAKASTTADTSSGPALAPGRRRDHDR